MIPAPGDIVWTVLDPVVGTEQAGRRPAIVVSDRAYHELSPRVLICPITTRRREWPFHVPLPSAMKTRGDVMVDQARIIDRTQRPFRYIETAPQDVLDAVRTRLARLLGDDLPRH